MIADAITDAVWSALPPEAERVALVAPGRSRLARSLAASSGRVVTDDEVDAGVVCFVGWRADPAARQGLLAGMRDRLIAGGTVVLVDHNQPRSLVARLIGAALLALRGFGPSRARYPAARELAALGFTVEALRLARGERLQLVVARRT